MKITILTLFPEMFAPIKESIIGRAVASGKVEIEIINIRDFSLDKHKKCDDEIFGGGAGMLMTAQPIYDAIKSVKKENSTLFYFSPKGKTLTQSQAKEISGLEHIILLCGHYEGIDERILDIFQPQLISIGDYVLTGGELPAMVLTDCVCRLLDGVITKESLAEESFTAGMLEYPQYTRPAEFMGHKVPEVLLSGNHAEIAKWKKQKSREETKLLRPDLLRGQHE